MKNYYYDKISEDYHLKRRKPWRFIENYFEYLRENGYIFNGYTIDLGCGNGRNFKIFKNENNKLIGIDNSLEFLKLAKRSLNKTIQYPALDSNNIQLILGDISFIPLRNNSIKNIFSIASLHHIKERNKRRTCINQLYNLLEINGYLLITVWRRWQKKLIKFFLFNWLKRKFSSNFQKLSKEKGLPDFGDKFVPWTLTKENISYNRYYHFFSKHEIKKSIRYFKIRAIKTAGGPTSKDNFIILAQKS